MATMQTLPVDTGKLTAYCRRWKISRLELFGSARFDWNAAQDVDLLVSFHEDAHWSLFDHVEMQR